MRAPRLTVQAGIIGAGRLLNMAAAAGTLIVLARLLPDRESYGAVCQLILLYMVLSQVFAVGLPQSTFYYLPRYTAGERRAFLVQTVILLTCSGVVLGSILYACSDLLGHLLRSPRLPELLRIFAIYPLFMLPTLALEGTLMHANRPLGVVLFNALVRAGMFCALVIPTWMGMPLPQTVAIWVAGGGVMCLCALWLMHSTVRGLPIEWRTAMLREGWRFLLPLAAVTLISLSANYIDRFLVSHVFGAELFGIYTNGTIEIPTVTMVTNATSVVLLAEFSRRTSMGDFAGMMHIWHRAMVKTGVMIFASLGFLAYWGHETMRLLFSQRFAESGTVFSIYIWIVPLLLFVMQPLYIASGSTHVLMAVTAFDLMMGILCVPLFGHFYGLAGMAFGAILARYLGTVLWIHWYVRWVTKVGWVAFMPWRKVGTALGIALLAGAISRAAFHWLTPSWPLPLLFLSGLLLYVLLYGIGLQVVGLFCELVPARIRLASGKMHKEVAA